MTDESFRHYFSPLVGNSAAKSNFSDNADTVIENNSIETVQTTLRLSPFAIKLYGDNVSSDTDDYPAYNYRIGNVSIKSNSIKTAGAGITMHDVYGVSLSSNDITVNSDADCVDSDLVSFSDCSDISFKNNTVKNSAQSALRVSSSDGITVSGNAFSDNVSCAVVFTGTTDSTVSKNTASGSGKGAVKISEGCSQITVSGNVIKGSSGYGIQISAAGSGKKDITVKSNDISGGSVGISCINEAKAFLMNNSFEAVTDKVYAESDGMLTLGKPRNFNAEEVTENRIKITWSSLGEADGIDVYRRRAGMADFELIATLESGALFQDEKLVAGTNYFYQIVPYIIIGDEKCETASSREIEARTKLNIENAYIDCVSSAGFTSRPITPKITIKAYSRELTAGVDYDYTFSNNLYPGTATVTVIGKGNYSGTLTHSFEITLSDRRISNAGTKNPLSGSAFSTESKRSYEVTCTSTGGMLLADSDETLNPVQLSIEAIRMRVPVCVTVTTAVWTDGGYEYFGR
jgi:parallel beta-helix repeat protein